jgi:hypothetical protein
VLGWLRRKTRWQFWPPWAAYVPLLPYLLYLGLKHRCLTLFTLANPGIASGGFVGERKSTILAKLTNVAAFEVIPASLSPEARFETAKRFLARNGLHYPVVLKPDVGERGRDVVIARKEGEIDSYLCTATGDTIIQRYVEGLEFGIFYYRRPDEPNGQIFSITEKRFPEVCGDGRSTIRDLILIDERAVCLSKIYVSRLRRSPESVLAAGESVRLAELGSHCRGAVFLNGAHLQTNELRSAVDTIAKTHAGFFFGRFDIKAPSIAQLQAGQFEILELNGVSAEATHIYDPSVSLKEAYRAMFRQWKIAFEIGAANREAGFRPMSLPDLLNLIRSRRRESGTHTAPLHEKIAFRGIF